MIARRSKNRITTLKDLNSKWVEKKEEVIRMITNFFKNLYFESDGCRQEVRSIMQCPIMEEIQNQYLIREMSNEKIKEIMFNIGSLKAPREDSFLAIFYRKN